METPEKTRLDLDAVRAKLSAHKGKHYWRSLEELAETDDFKQWLDDEFPHRASLPDIDRRTFLKFVGASMALAGLAGCRSLPTEKLVPYVKAPEDRLVGQTLYYASALTFAGYGFGVLVESNEGRPTKIEGNPDHPASLGSTDAFVQAEILNMYDPDRAMTFSNAGLESTWEDFLASARDALSKQAATGGSKVRILTEPVTSPTVARLISEFQKAYPGVQWHQYEPLHRDNVFSGAVLAFGQYVQPIYDFSKAKVVLSLDCDFMARGPHTVRNTRDFMMSRHPDGGAEAMNRLYVVETSPTLAGAFSDHRAPVKPSQMEGIVRAICAAVGGESGGGASPAGVSQKWIDAVSKDLLKNRGSCLVVASDRQSPLVHALVHSMNQVLGNVGQTVSYCALPEVNPVLKTDSLKRLVADMSSGNVDMLLISGGNAAFDAPADIKFADAIKKVKFTARLGLYENETSALCAWNLPEAHFLESWGDVRSWDGTASLVQPLIEPLFGGKTTAEVLSALLNKPKDSYDLVRETWKTQLADDHAWQEALNRGTISNSKAPAATVSVKSGFSASAPASAKPAGAMEVVFLPDPTIYDGRYANNGWLQELPKPLTTVTWDNPVHMSPADAGRLGLMYQDLVTVTANGQSVTAPVYLLPGHPDGVITLHLGYGRTKAGKVGNDTGFNFNTLRSSGSEWICGAEVTKAGGSHPLASAQTHHSMEGRDIVREGTLEEYLKNPTLKEGEEEDPQGLYNLTEEWRKASPDLAQWGMVIDLNTCIGCGTCVIACQSENNIPSVGKLQVQRGREMQWIRIDRYYRVSDSGKVRDVVQDTNETEGLSPTDDKDFLDSSKIESVFMPIPCMQCEVAPCEPVCPVGATVHSHEGLNQMVYNRCVGTRYCSNNCPYKVRRFNFYNFQYGNKNVDQEYGNRNFRDEKELPLLKMLNNPNVTVRSRGVMEKCTYCVQRINEARVEAKKAGRDIKDGDVVPACAQACPTKTITFGNIADPNSAVSKLKASKRNYSLLNELNTRPRTTYLGKVRNTNPEIGV